MLVVNVGHDKLILTEYDGVRYAFHKGIPVEIDAKVYNEIILSGHVNAQDIVPVEKVDKEAEETVVEKVVDKVKEKVKKFTKPKGKKRHGD
jgi:hypothetical protein